MGTRLEFFKGKLKLFSFLFLILLILFVNLGPTFAISRGDYLKDTTEGNKKEEQLLRKIEIIHETFPQQTDEAALYATVVHRGTMTDYIEDSYDENFDEEEFRNVWTDLQASFNKLTSDAFAYAQLLGSFIQACIKCWIEPEDTDDDGEDDTEGYYEENCVLETVIEMYADQWSHTTDVNLEAEIKKPKSIDLLTAATIVMLDSSGWIGTYSDEKYKEALAGEGLVGNLIHRDNLISNFVATLMNGVFCTVRNVMDIATDGAFDEFALGTYRPGNDFDDLKGFTSQGTSIADKLSRFYTMDKICALGFIGGTYNHVQNPDLSTEAGKEQYQAKKDIVAEQIVGLAEDLRASSGGGSNNCIVNPSASGAFATWKQGDPQWGSISLGGGGSMASIGCLVTSFAITIARSGTQITNLPSGYSSFNPGALATVLNQNGGFTGGGAFTWKGYQSIAPNVKYYSFVHTEITNTADLAETLAEELSTPAEGKYQKFIIINIHHDNSRQHWIAVDSVTDNEVTLFDPGGVTGNTLDANYSGWVVDGYKVIYATDVLFGQTGTSTGGSSGGVYCETGSASLDKLLELLKRLEGEPSACTVRGVAGYETYIDSMDQNYAGATTAYGITQVYNRDLAASIGYTNFDTDMSNGCVEKSYIDEMGRLSMEAAVENVRADYESQSGGKQLEEYQYHSLALVYHHWPVGVHKLIGKLAALDDVRSYEAYHWYLYYNGLGGAQGGLNRREVEYHLLYNGNYNAERVYDVVDTREYWASRVQVYQSEQVS